MTPDIKSKAPLKAQFVHEYSSISVCTFFSFYIHFLVLRSTMLRFRFSFAYTWTHTRKPTMAYYKICSKLPYDPLREKEFRWINKITHIGSVAGVIIGLYHYHWYGDTLPQTHSLTFSLSTNKSQDDYFALFDSVKPSAGNVVYTGHDSIALHWYYIYSPLSTAILNYLLEHTNK